MRRLFILGLAVAVGLVMRTQIAGLVRYARIKTM